MSYDARTQALRCNLIAVRRVHCHLGHGFDEKQETGATEKERSRHEARATKSGCANEGAPSSKYAILEKSMRQTVKRDRHSEIVEQRARKSATYRKTFARTLHQIDLALLVREMREDAALTQADLAKKAGTTQSVIARLEDAEYAGHSLTMLERIATACGVALKLRAEKKPNFDREVALV